MREWWWRLRAWWSRDRLVAEKREELELHVELEIEAGLRAGLTREEAARRARHKVGLVSEGVEWTRDEFGFRWIDGLALDLRHAWRALTRSRGYGAVAVLVLAASVALGTAIFCLLDGVVLRPLPYAAPERLLRVYDESPRFAKFPLSIGHFMDLRDHARSLQAIALYTGRDVELSARDGRSQRLTGVAITSDFFALLGRPPAMGRTFAADELRGAARVAIISHGLWRDHFQSDPAIIGRTVRLDREPWTVVGVAPAGFQHVGGEYRSPMQGESVDVWLPLALDIPERGKRSWHYCNAIARVRPGFGERQVGEELALRAAAYEREFPGGTPWTMRAAPLLGEVTGRSQQLVWLLVAAGALVLLLACANIAGLSVARAVARRTELALRQALGANRWQLVRVGLAENLLIGVAGAALGIALAAAGLPLLRKLLPADFPRAHEVALSATGAAFAATVAIVTALVAGLLPSRGAVALATPARITAGNDSRRLRSWLVAGEFALAGLLCAGSLFLLRSYQHIGARDHGFRAAGVLTFQLTVPTGDPDTLARTQEEIRAAIAALPGVAAVGATTNLPWSGYDENTGFGIVGAAPDADDGPNARFQAASPGYFEAAGMRLVDGRLFDPLREARGGARAVIVNDALVRRYFPSGRAVGAMMDVFGEERQIVGVVAGIADFPADLDAQPAFWFPLAQQGFASVFYAVRAASGDPAALTSAVAAAVHGVDAELAVADVRTLERRVGGALAARRFALSLFNAFAALALVLAAAGVYGLLAYVVQQRRKELGIRAALGASRGALGRMILVEGLKMAGAGAACCVLLIPVGGTLLQAFLYQVKPLDAVTLALAPAVLLAATVVASLGPARSATRSDPAAVLRED